jgi:hypothetical protein
VVTHRFASALSPERVTIVARAKVFSLTSNGAALICQFVDSLAGSEFTRIFSLDDEGKTWARGWNTKAANALRTVTALSS